MKQIKKLMVIAFATIVAFTLLAANAKADDQQFPHNPWVWVTDVDGNVRDEFNLNEPIVIHASASTPYLVTLWNPSNICVWTGSSTGGYGNWTLEGAIATNMIGLWTVRINQYDCKKYAVGQYNVIPEVAFGTLGAFAASLIALRLKSLKLRK